MKTLNTLSTLLLLIIFLNEVGSIQLNLGAQIRLGQGQSLIRYGQKAIWAVIPGLGYKRCGKTWCVANPGVTCDLKHHKCICPINQKGNGLMQCTDPNKNCLCTIHGDPHVDNFFGQIFTLPLPCSHVITDLTTSSSNGKCKVMIVGRASFPNTGSGSPTISYENQIDIVVESRISRFTMRIGRSGVSHNNLTYLNPRDQTTESLDMGVQTLVDEAGFHEVFIDECNVMIKYRETDGSFSLETPIGCIQRSGLCGTCRARWDNTPQETMSKTLQLRTLLTSLSGTSPIDHSDINIYPSCTKLTKTVQSCSITRKTYASAFCGAMLTDTGLRNCMTSRHGNVAVQDIFAHCYSSVCTGRLSCSVYQAVYAGCDASHVAKYLRNPMFCRSK